MEKNDGDTTTMTDAPIKKELKPCPFCGGEAEIDRLQSYRQYLLGELGTKTAIYCTKCDADMSFCHEDHPDHDLEELAGELIVAWNTRHQPATDSALADEYRWALAHAYQAGANDVHNELDGSPCPEFTEASLDYADSQPALRTPSYAQGLEDAAKVADAYISRARGLAMPRTVDTPTRVADDIACEIRALKDSDQSDALSTISGETNDQAI